MFNVYKHDCEETIHLGYLDTEEEAKEYCELYMGIDTYYQYIYSKAMKISYDKSNVSEYYEYTISHTKDEDYIKASRYTVVSDASVITYFHQVDMDTYMSVVLAKSEDEARQTVNKRLNGLL